MFVLVFVVIVMMMAVIVLVFLVLVFVVMFEGGGLQACHLLFKRIAVLHCREYFLARKLLPGRGYKGGLGVVLAHKFDRLFELFLARYIGVGKDYAVGRLYLVIEKFAEVLHVHLALCGVNYGSVGIDYAVLEFGAVHGADYIGELAHA